MLAFAVLVAGSFALDSQISNLVDPAALTALRFGLTYILIGLVAQRVVGLKRSAFRAPWRFAILGTLFASNRLVCLF